MQRKGGGHAQDKAKERQLGPPHKHTRTPPRRSERLRQGLKLRNKREIGVGPLKGKNSRRRAAAVMATVSAPAATGRKENLQAEAEAQAEGDIPSTNDNLRTGGRAVQVALEAYLRSGKNNGEIQ